METRAAADNPHHWAAEWVGAHVNYGEFELIWQTMTLLTDDQYRTLAERWENTTDRRLARGLALDALAPIRGNLAALTVRFLHVFSVPDPGEAARLSDEAFLAALPAIATEHNHARPAAAFHDALLATIAFPQISPDDYEQLRQPWAVACLPCPFDPKDTFGDRTEMADEIFTTLRLLPKTRLGTLGVEYSRVPAAEWGLALRAATDAFSTAGFPFLNAALVGWCVNVAETLMGEVPTDPAVAYAIHGAAAAELLDPHTAPAAAEVLRRPYLRALTGNARP